MMGTCIKTSIVNRNTYFLNPVISAISTSLALLLKSIASGIPTLLLRSCSQITEIRLGNFSFSIAFRRRHIMPIFRHNSSTKFTYNSGMDIYLDHSFDSRKNNKIAMHNHIRNTTHLITSTIGTHANFLPSEEVCNMEETNLLPSYPSIRPCNITLHQNTFPLVNHLSCRPSIASIYCTLIRHPITCLICQLH